MRVLLEAWMPATKRHPTEQLVAKPQQAGEVLGALRSRQSPLPGLRRSGASPLGRAPRGHAPWPLGPRSRPRTRGCRSRTARVIARSRTGRRGRRSCAPGSLRRRLRCGRPGRRRPRGSGRARAPWPGASIWAKRLIRFRPPGCLRTGTTVGSRAKPRTSLRSSPPATCRGRAWRAGRSPWRPGGVAGTRLPLGCGGACWPASVSAVCRRRWIVRSGRPAAWRAVRYRSIR